MKWIGFFLFLLIAPTMWAQAPQGFSYQGVIRNAAGAALSNQSVNTRFCIRQGSANGAIVYQELQTLLSNAQGLMSATVGNGTVTMGSFSNVDWANGSKFLQVDINLGNGWSLIGIEPLNSVPYALYAQQVPVRSSVTGDTLTIGQNAIIIPGLSAANYIFGCTNTSACNFNPAATNDDGSCHITGQVCDDGNSTTSNDQYNAQCVCAGTASYSIGSQGPAGGYVFYDKGIFSNGWRYLEVYPISFFGIWGCQGTLVSGITNTIGAGDVNTNAILAACSSTNAVARLVDNYSVNGFSDWYLPNNAEMNLIRDNLYANNIGNIPGPFHWTSSQQNATYGALYDFDFDFSDIQAKNVNISGIPVRKF
jgi:hypothetical protein